MVDNIAKIPYNLNKVWKVLISTKIVKRSKKLPKEVMRILEELLLDLEKIGPIQHEWLNYSKLTNGRYHCHLNYRYVAVWDVIDNEIRILEVTYVGSREGAPY